MSYVSKNGLVIPAAAVALAAPALIGLRKARLRHSIFTTDAQMTFDQATIDSTGVFLVGELEKLDPKLHMPLTSVMWPRDIDLREDVTIADEVSSYTNSSFAAAGGLTPTGKAWISKDANSITGIALDIGKTPRPLHLWGMEMKWTLPELFSAQQLGRPIDSQKLEGLKLKHNMDVDEMVYIGDASKGAAGMVNSSAVTPTNVVNGALSSPLWVNKTPDEVLNDLNTLLSTTWTNSAVAVVPTELRLPPQKFSYIASTKVSNAGNTTILEFVREKCISSIINNKPLNIQPLKWLTGRGAGGTDRMVAYTRNSEYIRYPLVPLQRTPLEYRSLFQITTYFGRLGEVEIPYPETVGYADGF
jgi:hypothetical protein